MTKSLTLERLLVLSGLGNRRHCAWLVRQGEISVNGRTARDSKKKIGPDAEIRHGDRLLSPADLQTWMLHKPVGTICQTGEDLPAAIDLLPRGIGLGLIGRLDVESEVLILATNDGDLAHRLAHPDHHVCKTYHVTVGDPVDDETLTRLCSGLPLDGKPTRPLAGRHLQPDRIELELTEGRKRQIRRLCESCGLRVTRLVRIRIGDLELGDLGPGQSRRLDDDEISRLRQAARE